MRVEPEYAVFGKILRKHRLGKKLSQEQLAALTDLTRTSIANIETGKQRVMLRDALILSGTLEFSLDEIKVEISANKFRAKLAEQSTKVKGLIEKVLLDSRGSQ